MSRFTAPASARHHGCTDKSALKPLIPSDSRRRLSEPEVKTRLWLRHLTVDTDTKGHDDAIRKISSSEKEERNLGAMMLIVLRSPFVYEPLLDAAEKEQDPGVKKSLLKALCYCAGGKKPRDALARLEKIAAQHQAEPVVRQAVFAIYHSCGNQSEALERITALEGRMHGSPDADAARLAVSDTKNHLLSMHKL